MELEFEVAARIARPLEDVFEAVHDPKKLSEYFTTAGASGPLDEGRRIWWEFEEAPGAFPLQVLEAERNRLVVFEWGPPEGDRTHVRIEFEPVDAGSTVVRIREGTWPPTQDNLARSYDSCMGWTQMIACLKAYLEYGINLRSGFFV